MNELLSTHSLYDQKERIRFLEGQKVSRLTRSSTNIIHLQQQQQQQQEEVIV